MKQEGLPPTDYNILRKNKTGDSLYSKKVQETKKERNFFCKITQGLLAILS